MSAPTVPIAIIGAGISGLSLAALLAARDIPFLLVERSNPSSFQGYGITLRSWAVKPFLASLNMSNKDGISESSFQSAVCVDAGIGGSGYISPVVRDGTSETGAFLIRPEGGSGGDFFRASRRRLREWLLERSPADSVKWECEVNIQQSHDSKHLDGSKTDCPVWRVISKTTGLELCRASIIVAADGINSTARRALAAAALLQLRKDDASDNSNSSPRESRDDMATTALLSHFSPQPMSSATSSTAAAAVFNGQRTVPRALFDRELAPYMQGSTLAMAALEGACLSLSLTDITPETATVSWTWSESSSASVDSINTEPDSSGPSVRTSNSTTGTCTSTTISTPTTTGKHLTHPEIVAALTHRLATTSPAEPFRSWLSPSNLSTKDQLYHWPMRSVRLTRADLALLSSSSITHEHASETPHQAIILIGDAAHAMPIFAGEGGNHAILDAVEFVGCLEAAMGAGKENGRVADGCGGLGGLNVAGRFYDAAHPRWMEGIERAEGRAGRLHMSLEKWRALAEGGEARREMEG